MNWEAVSAVAACVFGVFSGLNYWTNSQIKLEISDLKLEIQKSRYADIKELREWVEERYEPRVPPSGRRHYASN